MPATIGLFYGSSTCYTEMAGEKIRDCLNQLLGDEAVEMHNIADCDLSLMNHYPHLILGIPTWDYGELQEDWENCWEDLEAMNFSQQTVAVYGLGDQVGYPEWFQDALGYLWTLAKQRGARMVGQWPNRGYQFESSQALTADGEFFLGLSLDDENQFEQSDEFIRRWCQQLIGEFGLQPDAH